MTVQLIVPCEMVEIEVDVMVLGSRAAGLTAAITAHEGSAKFAVFISVFFINY